MLENHKTNQKNQKIIQRCVFFRFRFLFTVLPQFVVEKERIALFVKFSWMILNGSVNPQGFFVWGSMKMGDGNTKHTNLPKSMLCIA